MAGDLGNIAAERILSQRSIAALAGRPAANGTIPVQHVHSLGPARILVPPLPTGGVFFENWQVRELPEQGQWEAEHYDSFAPPLFVLHDVTVHSSAGILAVGDHVVSETLANVAARTHGFRALAKGIAIQPTRIQRLGGVHISILAGAELDYSHATLESLARLMAVPDDYLRAAESLLVPKGAVGQAAFLKLLDLLPTLSVREVGREETLQVETLVFPLSVAGESIYHPCVADLFRRASASVPPQPAKLPRRFYIDRRGTGIRPLRNESELIAALSREGLTCVRLETFQLADQIRLFRNAELIVGPHGAALTNLGFARPGCVVVELQMDAYVDWRYRNLAALMDLRYDCVLGRARRPWADLNVQFHQTPWEISVNHVIAAIAHSLDRSRGAQAA